MDADACEVGRRAQGVLKRAVLKPVCGHFATFPNN
jgi:hypothetical protein